MLQHARAPVRATTISIGEAARRCGLTARAIRLYERSGLVEVDRDEQGVRRFNARTLDELAYIGATRRAGLSIAEIGELLAVFRREGPAIGRLRLLELCRLHADALRAQMKALQDLTGTLCAGGPVLVPSERLDA